MKVNMFVNASFEEKEGSRTITARLRGVANAKSFKLPGVDASLGLEKNDGIAVEMTGQVSHTDKYATPANFKILEVVKGAYQSPAQVTDVDSYMQSLVEQAGEHTDIPF